MENKIKKYITEEFLDEENSCSVFQAFKAWLEEDVEHQKSYDQYLRIWNQARILGEGNRFNAQRAWEKVNKEIKRKKLERKRSFVYFASGVAASFILILGLSFFFPNINQKGNKFEIVTQNGNRTKTILPDGTVVELNGGSKLIYSYNYRERIRDVLFDGEGYFEVAKSKVPFVISTNEGFNIKVLGTKFNVMAYGDENSFMTSLVEGSVEIKSPEKKRVKLRPGETVKYNSESKTLNFLDVDVNKILGWKDGRFYMDNTSLGEVVSKLERWYGVSIEFEKEEMRNHYHYSGVLQEKTVFEVLNALTRLSNIKYKARDNRIVLSEKDVCQ